jgi:chromosome segregation protein
MYLSHLEIIGFKSFADKTVFTFKNGLSAIVGPNGSGKTNFVDAIRWVLGEQKTSVLRSDAMENVIFSGAKNRKPLGMAEVTITIQNNKKILPSEFEEVSIARRLYKDGESQYLINKVPARLKDIVNLFMDTGLGADSYSVIELKMIESILNGNPAERRDIIEEAAGVKKFKFNKKEATRKLQNVELDFERLNDILQEVEKNVNSLSRQASKTRRYNNFITELKELELQVFSFELSRYASALEQKEQQKEAILLKSKEIQKSVKEYEDYMISLKNGFRKIDEEFQHISHEQLKLNSTFSNLDNLINITEEKIKNIDKSLDQSEQEIQNSTKNLERYHQNRSNLIQSLEKLTKDEFAFKEDIHSFQNELKELRQQVNDQQMLLNNTSAELNEYKSKQNYEKSILSHNSQNKARLQGRIDEEKKKIENFESQVAVLRKNLENNINLINQTKEEIDIASKNLSDAISKKTEIEKLLEKLKNEEIEKKNLLKTFQNEKNFLENIAITDDTTKFLLKNNNWIYNTEKILFGEVLSTQDKYKKAINSILKDHLSYFLINNINEAKSAINALKNSKQGKTGFIILDTNKDDIIPQKDLPQSEGIIGWLSEFIQTKDEYSPLVHKFFDSILLVENLDIANKIIEQTDIKQVVTIDGSIITSDKIIYGGGDSEDKNSLLLGRRNRIQELEMEISHLTGDIEKIQNDLKMLQTNFSELKISEKEQKYANLNRKLNELEKEKIQLENKIQNQQNSFLQIQENIAHYTKEIDDLIAEASNSEEMLEELAQIIEECTSKLGDEQSNFADLQNELDELNVKIRQKEISLARLQSDIKHSQDELLTIERSIKNTENFIENKQKDIANNRIAKQTLNKNLAANIKEKEELVNELEKIQFKQDEIAQNRQSLQQRINQYEESLENLRKSEQTQVSQLHNIDLEIANIQAKIENIKTLAREQYQLDFDNVSLDYFQTVEDNFDIDSAKISIALLKEKISALGNVNFQALEDYEEQKQRLDFLINQKKDLENSQKTLNETIDEINKIAEERFRNTFENVRRNFTMLFKDIFGEESEADLYLEGNNLMESNVSIIAKPPFKKPSSIDLLSAGEKTLTAIALLFAIYLEKPSPFCILDEVDAPLDDTNIDKFINLLKKFSVERDIQFIVITHNKRTMEAADTLYGLTMEEQGATKVVSVHLEKT